MAPILKEMGIHVKTEDRDALQKELLHNMGQQLVDKKDCLSVMTNADLQLFFLQSEGWTANDLKT